MNLINNERIYNNCIIIIPKKCKDNKKYKNYIKNF